MTLHPHNDRDRAGERQVLILIGGGIIGLIAAVIAMIALLTLKTGHAPDFSETVCGAIVGGGLVKIADVLSALVALSNDRQLLQVADRLTTPHPPASQSEEEHP